MKKFIIYTALALSVVACGKANSFHIYGTVTSPELEGACIFLVPATEPVIEPTKENLDSTFIKDGKFEFHGTVERMADIRIERGRRHNVQNLLVVTEPGTTEVIIGKVSSSKGTPQNDSLQVWKDLTEEFHLQRSQTSDKAVKDSLRQAYNDRSRAIAEGCGPESTAGSFLLHMFPKK